MSKRTQWIDIVTWSQIQKEKTLVVLFKVAQVELNGACHYVDEV